MEVPGLIDAAVLRDDLEALGAIGVGPGGVVDRLAWTAEDKALGEWFEARAARAGLRAERDLAGNRWAVPNTPPPWWGAGSHLDSVRAGGRFDGPLGVVAAFAVAERSSRSLAVVSFADEEGARYNTPTFGSRALVGRLDVEDALARRDDDGVPMLDAMRAAGVDPKRLAEAPERLSALAGFLELHIDQSRALERAGAPAAAVYALAARLRLEIEVTGSPDHAGTTPRGERADAMLAAARLIVAAEDVALPLDGVVTTATRILAEPNAPTAVAGRVRLWIDARGPSSDVLAGVAQAVRERSAEIEATHPTGAPSLRIAIRVASRSAGASFDARVRAALRDGLPAGAPETHCYAGHDAAVLAEQIPAGMVLVRNPTGISHAPAEEVALEDAAVGATALLHALEKLA